MTRALRFRPTLRSDYIKNWWVQNRPFDNFAVSSLTAFQVAKLLQRRLRVSSPGGIVFKTLKK